MDREWEGVGGKSKSLRKIMARKVFHCGFESLERGVLDSGWLGISGGKMQEERCFFLEQCLGHSRCPIHTFEMNEEKDALETTLSTRIRT